jgi:HK97 family phage major capsid protein
MNLAAKRERANELAGRMSSLGRQEELSADEVAELDRVLEEFNGLMPQIERETLLERSVQRAAALGQGKPTLAGLNPRLEIGADGTITPPDRRSLAERFADSDGFRRWKEGGGLAPRSDPFPAGRLERRARGPGRRSHDGAAPLERRTLIDTGDLPGYLVPDQVVPGIFRPDDVDLTIRGLLINGTTTSDTIYFIRELTFTNAAAPVAQATDTTGTSGTKPESALTFEQASAPVVPVAHWIPITRQALSDAAQLRTYLEDRLVYGAEKALDNQLLNGNGTAPNMTGFYFATGRQVLNAAYWTANPLPSAGTPNENFDRVLRARTLVRTTGRATADFVVLNPADVEALLTATDTQKQYLAGGPFVAGGIPRLWGLRVVESEHTAAKKALVGDGSMAAVWDREDATIMVDTINDQFVRNILTILCELRAALTIFRPPAYVELTLA